MRLLLDTHAFLWFVSDGTKMGAAALNALSQPENQAYLSVASGWEMAIKVGLGKLGLGGPIDEFLSAQMTANSMLPLPIEWSHLQRLTSLPFHHRDPFDRLLIAQAMVEGMSLVSLDRAFDSYDVGRVW